MEAKPVIELYDFLVESELQQYYNAIKNELKITLVPHLKYASDEDLKQVGLSKPQIRRLRKFYEKYYPHGYLSKIKRLLQNPAGKREEVGTLNNASSTETLKTISSPSKLPSNKHIIPADSICVNKQLGVGEFGIVQQGVWTNGNERIQVAIKCLCRERMQSNPMEFLKEAAIMHSIEHENIVRLYGVVLDTDSLMLVTELAHLRSLLECLKDSGLRVSFLTVPTLCEFAQQICSGMMYLENKRLIHRDLAARNILVFSKTKVKISDFGLSRALGVGKDYYQTNFNVNLKLPIAWCAPECINFLRFTNASDVWAYGVCLWEMFSYGFQPWAALTGHQILEAIDEPHYQRLEQPECCPKEYYTLMLKCWQHDPAKRPKFAEIHTILPDMKPEQLKTVIAYGEAKKEHLMYRQNDIITVLDKPNNTTYWKGVLNSGKTGMFDPSNTVAYLGNSLPSSVNRDSFVRGSERTSSRRKLCPEMISGPQNDLKHTGHVGLDGAYFGDVAFLSSSNSQSYNHVPRQIVTPYKPSEDIEQTPLLPSTPTSPDSLQTASGYFAENNHTFLNAHSAQTNDGFNSSFDFSNQNSSTPVTASNAGFTSSNPFVNLDNSTHNKILSEGGGFTNILEEENFSKEHTGKNGMKWVGDATSAVADPTHEYHEISDDEMPGEKFDLGPSLLDEMDFMFRSMSANSEHGELKSPDFENNNKKNEIAELAAKFQRKNSGGLLPGSMSSLKTKKKSGNVPSGAGNVKPISTKDEKMLNQAIDFANEISARSMTDLVNDSTSTQSPKRKFSFRFPHLVHHSNNGDKDLAASPSSQHKGSHGFKTRNFSEEAQNVPDLQRFRSLSEIEKYHSIDMRYSHGERDPSFEYRYRKMREFSSRPFKFDISAPGMETDGGINDVNYNGLRGNYENSSSKVCTLSQKTKDFIGENLIDIENTLKALNLDFLQTFNDLEKNDSAETLFGENYTYDATNINPKILNKALKLSKIPTNYSSMEVSPKSTKSSQYSPLDKQAAQPQFHGSVHYLNESGSTDKLLDGKRSSTPDTGFASRETNTSSRRGSQKSSYSPQDTHFSPSYTTQIEEARAAYAHLKANGSFPSRQRSMSFTENYDLKSPVLSEPQFAKIHNSTTVGRTNSSDGQAVRRRHRNTISHKPKSIRARNLRRLSYNPIILDSSSSSNSENEFNHRSVENVRTIDSRRHHSYRSHRNSAASPIKSNDDIYDFKNWHTNSESDIRLKNRKTQAHFQSNISYTPSQDRLYGSNASIKSAPQYNNFACDRQMQNYLGRKMNYPHAQYNDYADQLKLAPSSSSHASNQTPINFERNAHRSSSRRRQQQQTLRNSYLLPPPPPPPSSNNRTYDLNAYSLFSQFDVSKLTGKSPTTQSFLQDAQSPSKFETKPLETKQLTATSNNSATSNTFQWPEKIHVSAVAAQNSNIMWPQKPSVQSLHTVRHDFSSDGSSSTETEFPTADFNPRLPPSPAP
ncbi:activated Cdc42 kinase-like [Contarinia nasturtii]|uniref:activated Cdc42 kinase-like n=1 Tax=Contarinia nasturtii TaxID=265458 RepID=UPI0012D3E683|nr:activated Cdc42 kinase-like [Contarinia nasturtii]